MRLRYTRLVVIFAMAIMVSTGIACEKADVSDLNLPELSLARLDFADMPNGPAPTTFAGGPTKVSPEDVADDPGSKLHVKDGKLTVDPTKPKPTSSYFTSPDLGAPVVKIGARWTFNRREGSPDGAMALVISNSILRPPFPVHLSVTAYGWGFGVWPPLGEDKVSELDIIGAGFFDPPLKDDGTTVHEAEVTIDGDRAIVKLPDGQRRSIRDKRIGEWAGNYATFESWAKNGLTDATVAFTEVWAGRRLAG